MDLVDAQQARRVLDRLVAIQFRLYFVEKVKKGLSAGRSRLPLSSSLTVKWNQCLPTRRILDNWWCL